MLIIFFSLYLIEFVCNWNAMVRFPWREYIIWYSFSFGLNLHLSWNLYLVVILHHYINIFKMTDTKFELLFNLDDHPLERSFDQIHRTVHKPNQLKLHHRNLTTVQWCQLMICLNYSSVLIVSINIFSFYSFQK